MSQQAGLTADDGPALCACNMRAAARKEWTFEFRRMGRAAESFALSHDSIAARLPARSRDACEEETAGEG